MNPRICQCCGEPMPEQGNSLSRNPNICASCSSMADGMEETDMPESVGVAESIPEAHDQQEAAPEVNEPVFHRSPS